MIKKNLSISSKPK